ncbi:acyl-CoA thioesterase [Microbacterium sp. zg.Y1090]|uniref:acyl-CoA thioesterase n=1 Tax=Microbacterium TaxID=33882 RepID=UPI00214B3024|nr:MULTISPECIES: thioesterase family protein [unclassified Microbacterium]MCR2813306.1 acyl-CoA thioesterase [Microbacterium sp. zg.Y1084]MCR2819860.1 acyl-CoA thioesterase [Microbacterium sp. zg.Y1090]MDL5487971.1 thioesterase family protein [Microbacterium sp. zg-Y1211]WIM28583.1 thioesterase family protein [Microbacterium sp. zg-Y1090]
MTDAVGRVLHEHVVRLSYADTDPAGILYYAAWFPKMEALQSEFLYLQGLRQDTLVNRFGWWTVSRATQCEYLAAARLFDQVRIELRMGRIGSSSFRFAFRMVRVDDGVLVARAENTVVTVSPEQTPVPIPRDLRAHLTSWAAVA